MEGIVLLLLAGVVFVLVGAIKGMLARAHGMELEQRLGHLEKEVKEWRRRAEAAETRGDAAAARAAAESAPKPAALVSAAPSRREPAPVGEPTREVVALPAVQPVESLPIPAAPPIALTPAAPTTTPSPPPMPAAPSLPPTSPALERPADDHLAAVERQLGVRWMTWLGLGILFLGVAFFLKYAYDRDWLGRLFGPKARIATATGVAGVLLVTGWRSVRGGLGALGHCLLGGGQALLYLTVFAALEPAAMVVPAPLLGPTTAFVLMSAITALGLAAAVRLDAAPMAVIALLGGFATPLLIDTGRDARDALCTYLLLLDLGVLAVAIHRRWRALDLLAFAGTAALFGGWWVAWSHAHPQPDATLVWLAVFHLVFALLPFVPHWRQRSPVTVERFALATTNVVWTLGMATWLLHEVAPRLLAFGCLGGALMQGALGVLTARRIGDDHRTRDAFFVLATLLLSLGLFFLLPTDHVATAWFGEACALLWLGHRFANPTMRGVATLALGTAVVRTLGVTLPARDVTARLVWNRWFVSLVVAGLGTALFARVQCRLAADREGRRLGGAAGIGAGLWFGLVGALELARHASGHAEAWRGLPVAAVESWWLTLTALAFVALAHRWTSVAVSIAAKVPLGAAAIAVAVAYADYPPTAWPVLNLCCGSGLAVLAAATLSALADPRAVRAGMFGSVHLGLTALATAETAAYVQRAGPTESAVPLLQALGWVWLALGAGGTALGTALRSRLVCVLAALPLVAAVGVGLLIYDAPLTPHRLLVNRRFIFVAASALVLAAQRRALRRLGWPAGADLASAAALFVMLLAGMLEGSLWSASLPSVETAGWSLWLIAATATVGGAAGGQRAFATGNGSLRVVAMLAMFASLPLALAVHLTDWTCAWMFVNGRTGLIAAAIAAGEYWRRRVPDLRGLGRFVFGAALLAMTAEPPSWIGQHVADAEEAHRLALFSVTVTWVVLAIGMLVTGFRWHRRWLRLTALGLFVLTAAKVLLFDMAGALRLYRVLAFLLVGAVMILASWAYHRLERRHAAPPPPPA